jgi:hypothetical protein
MWSVPVPKKDFIEIIVMANMAVFYNQLEQIPRQSFLRNVMNG